MATVKPIENALITHEDLHLFHGPFVHFCTPSFSDPKKLSKFVAPATFAENIPIIKDMECFDDDVWVVGHAKTGTHWAQEMIWLLNNDLNYASAREQKINDRYVFIEGSRFLTYYPPEDGSIVKVKKQSRARYIKTHLITELLPDQVWTKRSKVIYVARNPKDVVVSWFHHCRSVFNFQGSIELFMDAFLADELPFGSFFDHVLGSWATKDRPNVLFFHYEDMRNDLNQIMRKTANFLGKTYSDEQSKDLADHLSMENMRKNPALNYEDSIERNFKLMNVRRDDSFQFLRKGRVGSHKEEMSSEYIKKFDDWIEVNLESTDFKFKY